MAPAQPQYPQLKEPLPELDLAKCFSGEQYLISWEAAYTALCEPATAAASTALRSFLEDDANAAALSAPWQPFAAPSGQAKAKFESKTARVSVTPSSANGYSLDEIKADALWLSKLASIAEDEALRLAILEWQQRPATQLLSGLTEEEAVSVHDAAGLANLGASTFVPNSSIVTAPSGASDTQFDSEDQRRLRILQIYFSTRISIVRTSQLLVSWAAAPKLRNAHGSDYRVCVDWLETLGGRIVEKQRSSDSKALDRCLDAIEKRWKVMDDGFAWDVSESTQEAVHAAWLAAHVTEIIHLLHLAVLHADLYTDKFLPTATVERWFTSAADRDFYRNFALPLPDQQHLVPMVQLLTSVLSLAILKVNVVLDDLETGAYKNWDPSCYLLSGAVLENITNVFGYAKALGPSPATPPAFAWAIISWKLTSQASEVEQGRDLQIEGPSRSSGSAPTALEEAVLSLTRLEASEVFERKMPFQDIAETCESFGVLEIVVQLVDLAMASFGTDVDKISRDQIRFLLLHLIRSSLRSHIVAYSPELILCTHAVMTGERSFRNWIENDAPRHLDPITAYCLNDNVVLRPLLIDEARIRYPYELTPFLRFFSILTRGERLASDELPSTIDTLVTMQTLMQRLPDGFKHYTSIREEENANWVSLSEDIPQFVPRASRYPGQRLLGGNGSTDDAMTIQASTEGTIVDDSTVPFVALWNYHHSALEYLVKLLSTYVVGSNTVEYSSREPVSLEHASEIIGFFADLLYSSLRKKEDRVANELLDALDIGVERSQDTANIILAIFEQGLLTQCQQPGNAESLELLVNCIHFVQALVRIAPNRVWPWLARSQLLHAEGNASGLASVLVGTEMVLGRYDLLIGCIQLFQSLVDDAVSQSVARKARTKALTRFGSNTATESGTSDKIMSNILLAFGRTLANVYEGSVNWKYLRVEDRLEINIGICTAFNTILRYTYGVDDSANVSSKVTGLLAPISEYLTELYLSESGNGMATNPLLALLLSGATVDVSSFMTTAARLWKQQTCAALELANTLVRLAVLLNRPWTQIEQQLFKATPLLARLYATSDVHTLPVLVLLQSLVRGAVRVTENQNASDGRPADAQSEPPSLLGHLGPKTAKNFLTILSRLDAPLRIMDLQTKVWDLLSAVVTCKQQWFSLYLLTGSTPRESLKKAKDKSTPSRNKALLSRALETIARLDLTKALEPETAAKDWRLHSAMLEFIASSQNNWAWAMGDLKRHADFIQKLIAFLKWLAGLKESQTDELTRSYLNRFASLTCQILAMHLHSSRQIGDYAPLKDVVPSLGYLEEEALKQPAYASSLHKHLKENFTSYFNGVSLANLKRTTLDNPTFGKSFFYDFELANKVLQFNDKWSGRTGRGLANEMVRANLNLSLVESQVELLKNWKLLAVELSNAVDKHETLPRTLVRVVRNSMMTNAESSLQEALFTQLTDLRADLAFIVLQRMVNAKADINEARTLLLPVWNAVRAATPDFETVFSSDGVHYYRSLLRILYLALQFHLTKKAAPSEEVSMRSTFRGSIMGTSKGNYAEPVSNQLLEILADAVAKGFRGLATQLHSEPQSVSPADFALLTAILQTVLSIPEMTTWHAQAALLFANSNTVRYATSLFSWSDRLTLSNGGVKDPIYGELSILFILSLSNMQPLAETMAVEGILSQLNAANLMNYYRRPGGMSPFDSPPRLFSIWTKGILPLCLNLLQAVGASIAGEISAFLNQFPEQLTRASNALNVRTAGKITLSLVSETHSLALLSSIIEASRTQAPRLGIQASDIPVLEWDKESVKEDIDSWISRKGSFKDKIIVLDERDAALFEKKIASAEAENMLEERVLKELYAAGDCLGLGEQTPRS